MSGDVVAHEVASAAEAQRVADLLGRCVARWSADEAADIIEAAAERAAIQAEGLGAVRGLVSVPTTRPERAAARVEGQSRALRRLLKAAEVDRHRARIARMRQAVGFSARCQAVGSARPGYRPDYVVMLTLTYRQGEDWKPEHISDFLHTVRKAEARRGRVIRYVWVAELQERGAMHYHVAMWLPAGVTLPKPDACGWWPHGSSRIEAARDAVAYLMKYLSKGTDTSRLPKGARMHGAGGLEHAQRRAKRWLSLPGWVQSRSDVFDDWRPAVGGGWSDPEGTVIPSEHVRAWVGDRWTCVKVADYGRPFEASGPFTWLHRGAAVSQAKGH